MPGHAGSPYWAAVDFDSEGDDDQSPGPNQRMYLDPWENKVYGTAQESIDSTQGEKEIFNSFVGEPVSASFYYVPTKNHDESEDDIPTKRIQTPPAEVINSEYGVYGRRMSRMIPPEYHREMPMYGSETYNIRDRRRSIYHVEDPIYQHHPMMYEQLYGPAIPPPPLGYYPPPPRSRMSLPHHPHHAIATLYGKQQRRHSRLTDAYEHLTYESLSPDYEDWARPYPKAAPENFHLSRYGHLQIDYSFSWNSLDRLIRNY